MTIQKIFFAVTLSIAIFHTSYIHAGNSTQQDETPDEKRTHTKIVKSKKQSPPLVIQSDIEITDKASNAAKTQPALNKNK